MNISETPAFYETDITDKNMSLERKMVSNISSFCICEMEDKEESESSRNCICIFRFCIRFYAIVINISSKNKCVKLEYFKFECVETFRKHSSFVFPWPLHRRDQCWPHRCRRGWRSERKQRFSLPAHIWLNFLKSVWISTSQFSCVQTFTSWRNVPRKSITIFRIHPQSGTRDESRDKNCIRSLQQQLDHANISERGFWWVGYTDWSKGHHVIHNFHAVSWESFVWQAVDLPPRII